MVISEVFTDPPEEEEITKALEAEWGEYLKPDPINELELDKDEET